MILTVIFIILYRNIARKLWCHDNININQLADDHRLACIKCFVLFYLMIPCGIKPKDNENKRRERYVSFFLVVGVHFVKSIIRANTKW